MTGAQGSTGAQGVQGSQGSQGAVTPTFVFTSPSTLTTTDNMFIPWLPGRGTSVTTAQAQVKTAPTGANINVDLRIGVRATGVLAAAFATVVIAAGTLTVDLVFGATLVDAAHFLAAEITQVGSTIAGSDLTVEVF